MAGTKPEGRRAKQRRQLLIEITDEARRLLEAGGPAAVGWNAIARKVELSPSSLYTYFSGLDELFTELLLQSYGALQADVDEALRAFADAPLGDRLLVGPLAYRRWAISHPAQFNLIFTDQIRGYVADPDGPTTEAQLAVLRPIASAFAVAMGGTPTDLLSAGPIRESFLGFWSAFHGLTILEANHHLDWTAAGALYEAQVRWHLRQLNLPSAAKDTAKRLETHRVQPAGTRGGGAGDD